MPSSSSTTTFHRLALVATASCLVLQLAGGWVHATGSSLACPDWPLCHGTAFPPMVGGILYEHGHRLMAAAVAALVSALSCLALWSRALGRSVRLVAFGVTGIIVVQSTLGGLTVLLRLPPAISTAHLALSQVLFVALLFLALHTRPKLWHLWLSVPHRQRLLVATAAVFLQEVLGALVRHLGAGRACGTEFPLCRGALLPSDGLGLLQVSHRIAAFALVPVLVWATLPLLTAGRGGRLVARVAGALLVAQILLGIGSVVTRLAPVLVTLHLGGGAVLLACLFGAYLLSHPATVPNGGAG